MGSNFSFVPSADDKLLNWSTSFRDQIVATPTAFFLTSAIASAYSLVHNAYATALTAALNETTRTKSTIATKDACKATLQIQARSLGGMIQKNVNVSDAQKLGLGITVRAQPQPIPPPSTQPLIEIVGLTGRTVTLRFKSTATQGRRGRPAGVAGLQVYWAASPTPPADPALWNFAGTTTKTLMSIELPESIAPGTLVYYTASWMSPRMQTGPAADPVSAYTQYGSTVLTAATPARKRRAA